MDERETMNTRKHSNRSRDTNGRPSIGRRRALAVVSGLMVGLAGCLRPGTSSNSIGKDTGSVFEGISFDGPDLLVHLREDHGVSSLNLIGPSGEAYRTVGVRKGETAVRIPILRIEPGRYEHYTPGDHELIAEIGERIESRSLKLVPELQIVEVKQHSGEHNRDYGNLEVVVENVGSGPTWVYDIRYKDAPNDFANRNRTSQSVAAIFLSKPENPQDATIGEDEIKTYVGIDPPMIFNDPLKCTEYNNQIKIILKSGDNREYEFNYKISTSGRPLGINPGALETKFSCEDLFII